MLALLEIRFVHRPLNDLPQHGLVVSQDTAVAIAVQETSSLFLRDEDDAHDFFRQREIDAEAAMTTAQLVDALTYANYKFNRMRSPEITPEQWAKIYPQAEQLEERYQRESS